MLYSYVYKIIFIYCSLQHSMIFYQTQHSLKYIEISVRSIQTFYIRLVPLGIVYVSVQVHYIFYAYHLL